MFYVKIDETGNLGKSEQFFIITAVVFKNKNALDRAKRIIYKIYKHKKKNTGELKSTNINFDDKQFFVNKLIKIEDIAIYAIIIDKNKSTLLHNPNVTKNLAYNFFSGKLIKHIIKNINDEVNIVFDQRSTAVKSQNSLKEYLSILVATNGFKHKTYINQVDSKYDYGVQTADLIAGIFRDKFVKGKNHLYEKINTLTNNGKNIIKFPYNNF